MDSFKFNDVDLALTCCGYAIRVYKEMAESFRRKHDLKLYVELMKPQFLKIFMDMYEKLAVRKYLQTHCVTDWKSL